MRLLCQADVLNDTLRPLLHPAHPRPPTPDLQRVFKFDQSEYLRDVEYHFIVRATNNFGESDNSGEADVETP